MAPVATNAYTAAWFAAFLDGVPVEITAQEVAAVGARVPAGARVLDICCGTGRHTVPLVSAGYHTTGIDRDLPALRAARAAAPDADLLALDMRHLGALRGGTFDAALLLWQSFGYFTSAENDAVLARIARVLHPGGLLLIDLVHPAWYRARTGRVPSDRPGVSAVTTTLHDARLTSEIDYANGSSERFDFETFEPEQLAARATRAGLSMIETSAWWDPARPADGTAARYQAVLRVGSSSRPSPRVC